MTVHDRLRRVEHLLSLLLKSKADKLQFFQIPLKGVILREILARLR